MPPPPTPRLELLELTLQHQNDGQEPKLHPHYQLFTAMREGCDKLETFILSATTENLACFQNKLLCRFPKKILYGISHKHYAEE